jgi:hypothetical protein
MTDAIEYRRTAIKLYEDYLAVQEKIAAIEAEALRAAQNDSRAAGVILLNRPDTDQGYTYLSLCKERDHLMKRAELAATMSIMWSVLR